MTSLDAQLREALAIVAPEAERAPLSLYDAYVEQDARLVAAGWNPTSPFWLEQLRRVSEHPTAYCFVAEVGRRGGKSTTGQRIGPVMAVDMQWTVPAGDPPHVFAYFSVKQGEAMARLNAAQKVLEARGVPHRTGTDKESPFIRIEGRNIELRALPANHRTAVGFTLIGAWYDELPRWIDRETSANPAGAVLSAARPAMLTHLKEGAREFMIGAPMFEEGIHWEAMRAGDTEDQLTVHAVSWEANPTTTPEECMRLCRADQLAGKDADFDRDYGAIPTPIGAAGRLDPGLIKWLDAPPEKLPGDALLSGSDLGMTINSSAQALGWLRGESYYVKELHEWRPEKGDPLRPSVVCAEHRANMVRHGAHATMADGHYRESLREALETNTGWLGLLDAPSQTEAVIRLRTLMQDGQVYVYASKEMRARLERQLRGTRVVKSKKSQASTVEMHTAQDGNHCDVVAALSLMTWQIAGHTVPEPRAADYDPDYERLVARHRELGLDRSDW